ncbi:SIR2 family protein [Isoptericola sp. S6320L]|uniref:P-loop NTPase n=1 Tax=Isoptericola sp. S6320L TaxID=2926411 RepID=UPI001FF24050|nr:SIR2 family protein [Isoptericola sp. S6320L]MCK0115654.1 SIR2 family protein [Isoptericola sp. S6320L]
MPHLPDEAWTALLEGIVRRKYQLLLGAGFSRAVDDRLNRPLPTGSGLRDEIVNEFAIELETNESIDLSRAFEAAGRRTSLNGQTRNEWITYRFTQTRPPEWFAILETLPLQTIWTLNIDDSLEQSSSRFSPKTFADKHETLGQERIPVIHLHGYARRPESGLIFTVDDYRNHVTHARSYALQFQEALSDGPVIVIGAALHHEFDLAKSLRSRAQNPESKWPSVVITPEPSKFEREEFAEWGLQVVDATAEKFLESVRQSMPEAQIRLAPILASEEAITPATMRFHQQWDRITPDRGSKFKYRDFLSGAEPVPADIRDRKTISRNLEREVTRSIVEIGGPTLIHGGPFSGKSTAAYSIAVNLHRSGWNVYELNADEKFNVDAVLHQAVVEPHTLLVVDDAAQFAAPLHDLIERAKSNGTALRLLCVERTGPASRLLRWEVFSEYAMPRGLSSDELTRFVAHLVQNDRIGEKWRHLSTRVLVRELQKRNLHDFAGIICELVIGEQFEERVRRDYRSLDSSLAQGAYVLGCLLARVTKGAPVGLVAEAFGTTGRNVEQLILNLSSLDSVCTLASNRIRPRHRHHAELLLKSVVSPEEVYDPLLGLAHAVAPSLDVDAIRHETVAYRISAELLDEDKLSELIGGRRLEEFYARIESAYAWNSRYWEQRALAASKNHHFDAALNYSNKAIGAHEDAFSLNTAATVRFRALWASNPTPESARKGHGDAVRLLRRAREMSRPDSEHPFVTYFNATLRLTNLLLQAGSAIDQSLRHEWNEWFDLAERSLAFGDRNGRRTLDDFKRRWLRTATHSFSTFLN